ncbi:hypothetical protein OF83DRAFT_1142702 [Amylostereum chailletii]|nr:hypothetical protein OF83DRAFT_1142702 [Amylostereum chailletii]
MASADAVEPPVSEQIILRIGPILIGCYLNFLLFGISIVQVSVYYTTFPRDRLKTKVSVWCIFLIDIFQSIVVAGAGWDTLCSGWGRPSVLDLPTTWTVSGIPISSGIVAAWVQCIYASRIRILSDWTVIPYAIVGMALVQAGAAIVIGISFISLKDVAQLHDPNMFARTIVWFGGSGIADLLITGSMVYLLYMARKSSVASQRGERTVNRLLRMSIETGMATFLTASLELVFFLSMKDNNFHRIISFCLCKVYSNTLMVSLNSRAPSPLAFGGGETGSSIFDTIIFPTMNSTIPRLYVHDESSSVDIHDRVAETAPTTSR